MTQHPLLAALDLSLRGGCTTETSSAGPTERATKTADAEMEVAWSGCTKDWESSKSIDDAPGGRGHCRDPHSRAALRGKRVTPIGVMVSLTSRPEVRPVAESAGGLTSPWRPQRQSA